MAGEESTCCSIGHGIAQEQEGVWVRDIDGLEVVADSRRLRVWEHLKGGVLRTGPPSGLDSPGRMRGLRGLRGDATLLKVIS
eukprot:1423082-Rhodomonas_salina.1